MTLPFLRIWATKLPNWYFFVFENSISIYGSSSCLKPFNNFWTLHLMFLTYISILRFSETKFEICLKDFKSMKMWFWDQNYVLKGNDVKTSLLELRTLLQVFENSKSNIFRRGAFSSTKASWFRFSNVFGWNLALKDQEDDRFQSWWMSGIFIIFGSELSQN